MPDEHSNDDPLAAFGPNEWLVDELYEQYRQDKNLVDEAWWSFFEDYTPEGASGSTTNGAVGDGSGGSSGSSGGSGAGSSERAVQRSAPEQTKPEQTKSEQTKPEQAAAAPPKAAQKPPPAPKDTDPSKDATAATGTKESLRVPQSKAEPSSSHGERRRPTTSGAPYPGGAIPRAAQPKPRD
ncbi:MAG: hypothetical protein WCA30_02845, partial [Dermatophilaceae bacterium]